jgi:6-phosphogluconolactonase (cycloisomerase 2 family)
MCRTAISAWLVLAIASVASPAWGQSRTEVARKIEVLIMQLDSDSYDVREKAEKELTNLGEKARAAIERETKSTSAEVRQRAARILRELKKSAIGLRHLASTSRDDMQGACGLELSPDGNFLYATAWNSGSINGFRRDPATGRLEHVQSLVDPAIGGVVCLRMSPDGKRAVAVGFRARQVTLLTRDPVTGTLTIANSAGPDLAPGASFAWPIHVAMSPDGKFVYAVDDRAGALAVFEATDDNRLSFVQFSQGRDGCFAGTRTLAITPDGKTVLVGGTRAGTLVALDRDAATGKVAVRQILTDEQDGVSALAGIHGINASPDGKHIYVTSGRFSGDQGVSVFALGDDGKLTLIQEIVSDRGELTGFQGGNKGALSPDGKSFYACGTTSRSLASFTRDPVTGKLTVIASLHDASTGAADELGPANVQVSPDGGFLYATLESSGAVAIFERTASK